MSSRRSIAAILVLAALAGCTTGASGPPPSPSASTAATALRVGLGFIPNVQFAPFYLADQEGFYRDAGLEVTFENKIDPDLVTLVGQGAIDVGLADGTSVIPAVSQDIPIRYVAAIYRQFPSIVFAKESSGIEEPADLAGRAIGIPGRFGSSWIMLQALLGSAGLTPEDVELEEYPDFGQGVAVQQDAVDAATGFINNEPVQLELSGDDAVVLRVDDVVPLPGNGLIVGASTLETKRAALEAFVAATLRAMEAIAENPELGVDASIAAVPDLGQNREAQAAILDATIEMWQGDDEEPMGTIETSDWTTSIAYLTELGLVPQPVDADDVVDTSLLPGG